MPYRYHIFSQPHRTNLYYNKIFQLCQVINSAYSTQFSFLHVGLGTDIIVIRLRRLLGLIRAELVVFLTDKVTWQVALMHITVYIIVRINVSVEVGT